MLMSGNDYRDSLRAFKPTVYLDGHKVDSVVDEPGFAPGVTKAAEVNEAAPAIRATGPLAAPLTLISTVPVGTNAFPEASVTVAV